MAVSRMFPPDQLARVLNTLASAGVLRVQTMPSGAVAIARPAGHDITTQILLNLQDSHWKDLSSKTKGRGYFALCRRLGVPLELALSALEVQP
jgi:hypothetical protein